MNELKKQEAEITRDEFLDYEAVRVSGKTNMFDIGRVLQLSRRLTREKVLKIFKQYEQLAEKYLVQPVVRDTVKQSVLRGFTMLRRKKFIARANYLCCMTCASHSLGERADKEKEQGKTVNGVVYWHRQDDEHLKGEDTDTLMLRYFHPSGDEEKNQEVAKEIVAEMKRQGLKVEWCGDTGKCIEIKQKRKE